MKNIVLYILLAVSVLTSSCIKEDIIDDRIATELRITNSLNSLAIGTTFQFETLYLDNVGMEATAVLDWTSTDETVATVDNNGLVTALKFGTTTITATTTTTEEIISFEDTFEIGEETILENPVRSGTIITTSSYALGGDFTLENNSESNKIILDIADNYVASTALPGLYIYLSNNPTTINGAFEIGPVSVFQGAHSYEIDNQTVGLNQYSHVLYWCKPFGVKVGEGEINN